MLSYTRETIPFPVINENAASQTDSDFILFLIFELNTPLIQSNCNCTVDGWIYIIKNDSSNCDIISEG